MIRRQQSRIARLFRFLLSLEAEDGPHVLRLDLRTRFRDKILVKTTGTQGEAILVGDESVDRWKLKVGFLHAEAERAFLFFHQPDRQQSLAFVVQEIVVSLEMFRDVFTGGKDDTAAEAQEQAQPAHLDGAERTNVAEKQGVVSLQLIVGHGAELRLADHLGPNRPILRLRSLRKRIEGELQILRGLIEAIGRRLAVHQQHGNRLLDRDDQAADVVYRQSIASDPHLDDVGAGVLELVREDKIEMFPGRELSQVLLIDDVHGQRRIGGGSAGPALEQLDAEVLACFRPEVGQRVLDLDGRIGGNERVFDRKIGHGHVRERRPCRCRRRPLGCGC